MGQVINLKKYHEWISGKNEEEAKKSNLQDVKERIRNSKLSFFWSMIEKWNEWKTT